MEWNSRSKIYLPLSRDVDDSRCFSCGASGKNFEVKLQLCNSCGEARYCSKACQKKDWKAHKIHCGPTVKIDLQTYYPFLACIAHYHHHKVNADRPHPALTHEIVNSPNPWNAGQIVQLPNGDKAKLVILGKKLPDWENNIGKAEWWPTAQTDDVRRKLARRIIHDGDLLPILLSICLALVSEVYSTTVGASGRRRMRFFHNRSPISDFGILHGSLAVPARDRLAFYFPEDRTYLAGQDPNDHYWIYFTLLSGEECLLDLGGMALNSCPVVDAQPYWKLFNNLASLVRAPALFYGSEQRKIFPLYGQDFQLKSSRRFSILRDNRLSGEISSLQPVLGSILDEMAGRASTPDEKSLTMEFLLGACDLIRTNLTSREYLNFPKEPEVMYEVDPGEEALIGDLEEKEYSKYMQKWNRKLKKGKITHEEWTAALYVWARKDLEAQDGFDC